MGMWKKKLEVEVDAARIYVPVNLEEMNVLKNGNYPICKKNEKEKLESTMVKFCSWEISLMIVAVVSI